MSRERDNSDAAQFIVTLVPEGQGEVPVDVSDRVLSWTYEDHERKADTLQLQIDNFDLANFDDPTWSKGNVLRFSFGTEGRMSPTRECVIRKVTGGRTLTIEAHGMAVIMDTVPKRRRWDNLTRSQVVEQIALENGFSIEDIEVTDEVHETITQANYTDAVMLRKLASLEGFEFFIDEIGRLHWHRRRMDEAPVRELVYYVDPLAGDIIDFDVETDVTRKPGRVRVMSRGGKNKGKIDSKADNATDTDRTSLTETVIIRDPETGKLSRTTRVAQEEVVAGNDQTAKEAERRAKGKFRKVQQTAVKMSLTIRGDASLVAKKIVRVSRMGLLLSGNYYVKVARHSGGTGSTYRTELSLVSDGFNNALAEALGSEASSLETTGHIEELLGAMAQAPVVNIPSAGLAAATGSLADLARRMAADPNATNARAVLEAARAVSDQARVEGQVDMRAQANELKAAANKVLLGTAVKSSGKVNDKAAPATPPATGSGEGEGGNPGSTTRVTRDPETGKLRIEYGT